MGRKVNQLMLKFRYDNFTISEDQNVEMLTKPKLTDVTISQVHKSSSNMQSSEDLIMANLPSIYNKVPITIPVIIDLNISKLGQIISNPCSYTQCLNQ